MRPMNHNYLFAEEFPFIDKWKLTGFKADKEMYDALITKKITMDDLQPTDLLSLFNIFIGQRGFEIPGFFYDKVTNSYFAVGFNGYIEHCSLHYLQVGKSFSLPDIKLMRHLLEKGGSRFDTLHFCGRSPLPPARLISHLCWIAVERIDTRLLQQWVIDAQPGEGCQLYDDYVHTLMTEGTFGLEKTEFPSTIIPPEFALRDWAHFAERLHIGDVGKTLLKGVNYLPFDLIKSFRDEPTLMRQISPRDFEVVVAEILARLQFEDVELTSRSADGGKDIIARRTVNGISMKFFFECKRYGPDQKVGVPHLRSLLGAVSQHPSQANIGVLATTSTFTQKGVELITSDARLDGKDIDDLEGWLNEIMASKLP